MSLLTVILEDMLMWGGYFCCRSDQYMSLFLASLPLLSPLETRKLPKMKRLVGQRDKPTLSL